VAHRTPIQIRFGDTDALGHVNNARFASYAELGRLDFLRTLGVNVRSLILANLSIDFRRQVAFDDTVAVESWVESVGRSSFRVTQVVLAQGERAADVGSVIVHYDYDEGRSRPIPDEMRATLERAAREERP
jgi:acyl-CoA thioester hydrolase